MIPHFLGVDVSKSKLDICLLSQASEKPVLRCSISNAPSSIKTFLASLKGYSLGLVCFEASGGYEFQALSLALAKNIAVVVVDPKRVRDFKKAFGMKAKTDQIDAFAIALFAKTIQPKPQQAKTALQLEMKELARHYQSLTEQQVRLTNRLETAHSKLVIKDLKKLAKATEKAKERCLAQILSLVRSTTQLNRFHEILTKQKGIGEQTACLLLALLPELGHVNRKQIAALAGLAPYDNQSGKSDNRKRIFGGRKEIRTLLYMPTIVGFCRDEDLKRFRDRLKAKGKPGRVVITAVMRKMLVRLNARVREEIESFVSPSFAHTCVDGGDSKDSISVGILREQEVSPIK